MRHSYQSVHGKVRGHNGTTIWTKTISSKMVTLAFALVCVCLISPQLAASDDNELLFKATSIIIETTNNDIELQAFVDGGPVKNLKIFDKKERKIFALKTKRKLGSQGLSELTFASEPDHFPEDALAPSDEANAVVRAFLNKFPSGVYEFEGKTVDGKELEGEATLTHVLPALPEIVSPVSLSEDPPLVDRFNVVVEWEAVTTRFLGNGPVDIIEYQVVLAQEDPARIISWIDGTSRRALINVPGTVTQLTIPPEFLLPNTLYALEVLAIEASGNVTISEGEFMTLE